MRRYGMATNAESGPAKLDAWLTKRGQGASTALAFRLRVSPETISRWRSGAVYPSYNNRRLLNNATAGHVPTESWEVE